MKLSARLMTVKPVPAFLVVAASLLSGVLVTITHSAFDDRDAQTVRYGETLAAAFADLAGQPVLAGDSLHLGVLAASLTQQQDVLGVSIVTISDEILLIKGEMQAGRPFSAAIAPEGEVIGYARLQLDPELFEGGMSPTQLLLCTLIMILVPIALLLAPGKLPALTRRRIGADVTPGPEDLETPAEPSEHACRFLVVNLYNQLSLPPERRDAELQHACALAGTVADLYGATVSPLPGTGVLLAFEAPRGAAPQSDPFHVICAGFVLTRLLAGSNGWGEYRMGAHRSDVSDGWQDSLRPEAEVEAEVRDTAMLSALARGGSLVVSDALRSECRQEGRFDCTRLTSPLIEEMETVVTAWRIDALAPAHEALAEQQARELAQSEGARASVSTF